MTKITPFQPAWWLKNPHLQTIWSTIVSRQVNLTLRRERLELPDGDFLDLDWAGNHGDHVVLVLHGIVGSSQSSYIKGILNAIVAEGWQGVLMHFRGCSEECNRLPRGYHSGETGDLDFVIQEIMKNRPKATLSIIGFSLGGNVLLKWLGERENNTFIKCAVAVSVPFDLIKVANRMCQGFSQVYQWWLLRKLKDALSKKFNQMESPIDLHYLKKVKTFWEFDDKITAPLHGFAGVNEYYASSSSRQYLKHIATPTLILHAMDDPFMTVTAIPKIDELSQNVTLELSDMGGHLGFIAGNIPGRPQYWLEDRIPAFLKQYI